jgi:hypothetical protein
MMLDYDAFRESFLDPGRWLDGEAETREATARHPADSQSWLCRGVVLAHLDRKDEARLALARSVELDGRRARSRWWLGRLLEEAGDFDAAAAQFSAATAADPDYEAARYAARFNDAARRERDAAATRLAAASNLGGADRYLLIRSWGSGFWSEILHLLGGLLTAELTGRVPVVWWGANCLFRDPDRDNAFPDFFEPVSAVSPSDLPLHAGPLFPPKWHAGNLAAPEIAKRDGEWSRMPSSAFVDRPEAVAIYDHFNSTHLIRSWIPAGHPWHGMTTAELNRAILARYVRPRPEFIERAANHMDALFGGNAFDAVHLRGTDKATEMPLLDAVNAQSLQLVAESARPLFVQTDSEALLARVRAMAGARARSIECRRGAGEVGVHFERAVSPRQLGEEVLVDALVSRRAGRFVGNAWSSVSSAVRAWSEHPSGATLLGPFDMTLDHYGEYFA